jgi:hypothetical protein
MSTIANINTSFENFKPNKLSKFEELKMDSFHARKGLSYSIPNSFICKKDRLDIPIYVPTLGKNLKNQFEELQKLQSEISYVEEKINELDKCKNIKLTKV